VHSVLSQEAGKYQLGYVNKFYRLVFAYLTACGAYLLKIGVSNRKKVKQRFCRFAQCQPRYHILQKELFHLRFHCCAFLIIFHLWQAVKGPLSHISSSVQ